MESSFGNRRQKVGVSSIDTIEIPQSWSFQELPDTSRRKGALGCASTGGDGPGGAVCFDAPFALACTDDHRRNWPKWRPQSRPCRKIQPLPIYPLFHGAFPGIR